MILVSKILNGWPSQQWRCLQSRGQQPGPPCSPSRSHKQLAFGLIWCRKLISFLGLKINYQITTVFWPRICQKCLMVLQYYGDQGPQRRRWGAWYYRIRIEKVILTLSWSGKTDFSPQGKRGWKEVFFRKRVTKCFKFPRETKMNLVEKCRNRSKESPTCCSKESDVCFFIFSWCFG